MKLILLKNKNATQPDDPEWFVKGKIGEDWKDIGTGTTAVSKQNTNYVDMEFDDDLIVDKLRDIDWKPKGAKTAQFVKELTDERMKREYPQLYEEKREQEFQDY